MFLRQEHLKTTSDHRYILLIPMTVSVTGVHAQLQAVHFDMTPPSWCNIFAYYSLCNNLGITSAGGYPNLSGPINFLTVLLGPPPPPPPPPPPLLFFFGLQKHGYHYIIYLVSLGVSGSGASQNDLRSQVHSPHTHDRFCNRRARPITCSPF